MVTGLFMAFRFVMRTRALPLLRTSLLTLPTLAARKHPSLIHYYHTRSPHPRQAPSRPVRSIHPPVEEGELVVRSEAGLPLVGEGDPPPCSPVQMDDRLPERGQRVLVPLL